MIFTRGLTIQLMRNCNVPSVVSTREIIVNKDLNNWIFALNACSGSALNNHSHRLDRSSSKVRLYKILYWCQFSSNDQDIADAILYYGAVGIDTTKPQPFKKYHPGKNEQV